jgi:hypothetical protein
MSAKSELAVVHLLGDLALDEGVAVEVVAEAIRPLDRDGPWFVLPIGGGYLVTAGHLGRLRERIDLTLAEDAASIVRETFARIEAAADVAADAAADERAAIAEWLEYSGVGTSEEDNARIADAVRSGRYRATTPTVERPEDHEPSAHRPEVKR